MEISSLIFIVTDDCNFNCTYCFQKKEKKTINNTIIDTAVDFFYPYFKNKIHIAFYGGEPLLAYEKIQHAVHLLLEKNKTGNKKIEFYLTTNGMLLTEKMLDFFNRNKFTLVLSFDGLVQNEGRKQGTQEKMVQLIKQIRTYPDIHFEVNSVFSPQTVTGLSESLRFIVRQGVPDITFNISTTEEWNPEHRETLQKELKRLSDFLARHNKEKGAEKDAVPVKNFRFNGKKEDGKKEDGKLEKKRGIFRCGAGRHRMAVTPEGKVWGCSLFHDYFKTRQDDPQYRDYAFGALADFIDDFETRYPAKMTNYSELRQDYFQVRRRKSEKADFCFLCEDMEGCTVCPVNAAYSSGELGKIDCGRCRLIKIQANARRDFQRRVMGNEQQFSV